MNVAFLESMEEVLMINIEHCEPVGIKINTQCKMSTVTLDLPQISESSSIAGSNLSAQIAQMMSDWSEQSLVKQMKSLCLASPL